MAWKTNPCACRIRPSSTNDHRSGVDTRQPPRRMPASNLERTAALQTHADSIRPTSVRLDLSGLDDLTPLFLLGALESREFLRRAAYRQRTESFKRFATSGLFSAASTSADRRLTISGGVPAGAYSAAHEKPRNHSSSAIPRSSATSGYSGAARGSSPQACATSRSSRKGCRRTASRTSLERAQQRRRRAPALRPCRERAPSTCR